MSEGLWNRIEGWNEAFLTVVAIAAGLAALAGFVHLGLNFSERWARRRRRKQPIAPIYPPRPRP